MYERSAIVLERYFENLFGFNKPNNIVQNYKNYCELFEKFNSFQTANNEELTALEEFQSAENAIEDIQSQEEKLYKKNAKYEYNRDLIFNDITQKPEEIEKCMMKIEGDIAKTQNSLVTLREKFVEAVKNYNDKKSTLAKCKKNRRNAETEYNAIFKITKQNIDNIPEEFISIAKAFSDEENQEDLINIMIDNGKDEKIPFNNAVIRNAVKVGFDIQKRFIECHVDALNKTNKLIEELLEGAVSIELHEKTIRNINLKLDFLNAEKDYLVQFLDYERIMVIHGKRTHRNLMLEACENFNIDVVQINNLYELLLREISNKSTKKAYKELYNKSYLIDIEANDEKFKKEKNKINLSTATVMNTNYWRIEGIKNIYTVFYKDVVEVFGKDLDEFEVPKEADELDDENVVEVVPQEEKVEEPAKVIEETKKEEAIEVIQQVEEIKEIKEVEKVETAEEPKVIEEVTTNVEPAVIEEVVVNVEPEIAKEETVQKIEIEKKKAPKKAKIKPIKRYTRIKEAKEEAQENIEEEPDIFGDKFRNIEKQLAELDALDELDELESFDDDEKLFNVQEINEDMPYEEEDIPFEEESIFENIENEVYEDLNFKKGSKAQSKKKKNGILKNIMKINSKDKKKAVAN
jgi:hypothetical protein